MWWDYNEELHLKNVWQMGYEEGVQWAEEGRSHAQLVRIIKKVKKNRSLEQIADELEADIETIRPVYDVVTAAAPDFDIDHISRQLEKNR